MKPKPKQTPVEKAANINKFGRTSFVTHTVGLKERIQKMTEQQLLAVLDMSEDEQKKAIQRIVCPKGSTNYYCCLESLAFRFRDEVCGVSCENYYAGLEAVYNHRYAKKYISFYAFWTYQFEPIDIVIAALIAKEKNNEQVPS